MMLRKTHLPRADKRGNRPAVATAKAILARSIMRRRIEAGLEQQELALLVGMGPETISRIEARTKRPRRATIDRIEDALVRARRGKRGRT